VIPKECVERVTINREEFLSSIRLVNSTEVDPNKFPKILAKFERHRLSLESTWQTSDARDSIAINYTGKDLTFPLAPDQLADILGALTEDEVHIELIDELSQFVIKAGNFLGLTMPYRPT
jgi:DNA polymerase III sliding clamp (beta) subunit (PCNA family)